MFLWWKLGPHGRTGQALKKAGPLPTPQFEFLRISFCRLGGFLLLVLESVLRVLWGTRVVCTVRKRMLTFAWRYGTPVCAKPHSQYGGRQSVHGFVSGAHFEPGCTTWLVDSKPRPDHAYCTCHLLHIGGDLRLKCREPWYRLGMLERID